MECPFYAGAMLNATAPGATEAPPRIIPRNTAEQSEQEKLELAIIENLQRENLNPLETAWAYQKLIDVVIFSLGFL